jgi:hypothetical protein
MILFPNKIPELETLIGDNFVTVVRSPSWPKLTKSLFFYLNFNFYLILRIPSPTIRI